MCAMTKFEKLEKIDKLIANGMDEAGVVQVLELIGAPTYDEATIREVKLYCDLLPMGEEDPYTHEQRYLNFL